MQLPRTIALLSVLALTIISPAVAKSDSRGEVNPYDLVVSVAGSPEPVGTGELLSLTISVVNTGTGLADPVLIRTSTPEGSTFESASSTNGIVQHPDLGATGTVECTARSLDAGDRAVLRVDVRVTAEPGSTIRAIASATGPDDAARDTNPGDNTGRTAVPVRVDGASVNLGVAIAPVGTVAGSGSPLGYDLVVTNNDTSSTAMGVVVRAETPGGTTFSTTEAAGIVTAPAARSRGTVLVEIPSIGPGATELVHVTVDVTASAGVSVEMTASVASAAADPDASDNSDAASLQVVESSVFRLNWDAPEFEGGDDLNPPQHLVATDEANSVEKYVTGPQASTRGDFLGYNVYRSARPNVQPSSGTFFTSVPASAVTGNWPASPSGTFFVVTARYGNGESRPSNEASLDVPSAKLSSVKVTASKIVANGTGFSPTVDVFIDGIPFVMEAQRKRGGARFVQKGTLATGMTIGNYLAGRPVSLIMFRNENGGISAIRYPQ